MGDAFWTHQCSQAYLEYQSTYLRQLPPEAQSTRTASVLRQYEEELQRRGWSIVVGDDGSVSFQRVTVPVLAP